MTTHDPTSERAHDQAFRRELERYLATGPSQAPDAVVAATRAAVGGTHQAGWRRWLVWPRPTNPGLLLAPVAMGLALAVILVVGFLPRDQQPASTLPPPTPLSRPTLVPPPTRLPPALRLPAVIGAQVVVGGGLDGMTLAGDQLWIARGVDVMRLDAVTGSVLRTVQVTLPKAEPVRLFGTPAAVYALLRTTTATTFVAVIPLDGGAVQTSDTRLQDVVAIPVGDELWFAGAHGGDYGAGPGRLVKRVGPTGEVKTIPGIPSVSALGTDGQAVFGITIGGRLLRVDATSLTAPDTVALDRIQGQATIAAGPAGVWLLVMADDALWAYQLDPATGSRLSSVRVGPAAPVAAVVADRTGIWVATFDGEVITKVVPGGIAAWVQLPFRAFEAVAGESGMWVRSGDEDIVRVDLPVD